MIQCVLVCAHACVHVGKNVSIHRYTQRDALGGAGEMAQQVKALAQAWWSELNPWNLQWKR